MMHFESACRDFAPRLFLVLGSGMGALVDAVEPIQSLSFADLPGLNTASVPGHRGRLTLGRWDGAVVLISEGRLHYYEGNPWDAVVTPIRLAAKVGVKAAVLTNAAGGIRDDLAPGTLMPIRDHLQWNMPAPWREPGRPSPYSERLLDSIGKIGLTAKPGTYAAVCGPSYETPAEVRALRISGADAVGMSTSREALAGAEAGMEIAAISLVTNRAAGLSGATLSHEEVLATAARATERMGQLLDGLVRELSRRGA